VIANGPITLKLKEAIRRFEEKILEAAGACSEHGDPDLSSTDADEAHAGLLGVILDIQEELHTLAGLRPFAAIPMRKKAGIGALLGDDIKRFAEEAILLRKICREKGEHARANRERLLGAIARALREYSRLGAPGSVFPGLRRGGVR
jgi:hypothetical protein